MRITDQYFWNIIFLIFFICLAFLATVILESEAWKPYGSLTLQDYVIITLASFRVIRAVVYDKIFAFFREQFYDPVENKGKIVLVKPEKGPRRTLAELLACPWCFGIWSAAMVSFFYLFSPIFFYPILFLALAGVATLLQVSSNLIGWKAEELKDKTGPR
jgi:hypothetical protein